MQKRVIFALIAKNRADLALSDREKAARKQAVYEVVRQTILGGRR